ncbi:MAG: rhodanese-like domain-containing protein [Verrucomicrobiia bacterium]|jgi:rhodanese-related sulfurtransferase
MSESISAENSMTDVLTAYPGARRALFRKYHIGGCQSCGFQPEETVTELCERNGGLDVTEVIGEIRAGHEFDQALEIEPQDLNEKKAEIRLFDVRTREEWEAVRIEGAEFVDQQLVQDIMSKSDKDASLVFYDHSGGQSIDAAAYFAGHGFTNVKFLRGGIDAWAQDVDTKMRRYKLQQT